VAVVVQAQEVQTQVVMQVQAALVTQPHLQVVLLLVLAVAAAVGVIAKVVAQAVLAVAVLAHQLKAHQARREL
jgi:hypothetical protein